MPDHIYTLEEIRSTVQEIVAQYGVKQVILFGSYARGEASINSDIDLRIEKGRLKGLFQLAGLQLDLEEKLRTHVDLLTNDSLDEQFLKRIKKRGNYPV